MQRHLQLPSWQKGHIRQLETAVVDLNVCRARVHDFQARVDSLETKLDDTKAELLAASRADRQRMARIERSCERMLELLCASLPPSFSFEGGPATVLAPARQRQQLEATVSAAMASAGGIPQTHGWESQSNIRAARHQYLSAI